MNIYRTRDRLPEEGRYVLAWCGTRPWGSNDPTGGHFWKVLVLTKGISLEEREKLSKSKNPLDVERSRSHQHGDEGMNNDKPYAWKPFGAGSFTGGEVEYWAELPTEQLKKMEAEDDGGVMEKTRMWSSLNRTGFDDLSIKGRQAVIACRTIDEMKDLELPDDLVNGYHLEFMECIRRVLKATL